jgi:hypothetical protein
MQEGPFNQHGNETASQFDVACEIHYLVVSRATGKSLGIFLT